MTDETPDPQKIAQQAQEQSRHETEAPDAGAAADADLSPLAEAILDAYEAIEDDDAAANTMLQARSKDLAALLTALDRRGELEGVAEAAAEELDDEPPTEVNRARTLRLLVRVGLRNVDAGALQDLREAKRDRALEGL